MQYNTNTIEEYIDQLPEDRKPILSKLRAVVEQNLPDGFKACIHYKMIGYVVPHELYPDGYHCNPKLPLPFINIASQKNFVAVYHSGIYADKALMDWFVKEYPKHCKRKLDMGKSCIRFKYMDDIPYELIGELATKMTVKDWVEKYESVVKK